MWGELLGAGAGILGGMFSKKKSVNDPLAGIRAQLQGLANQVPGMVARQKELIGKNIAEAKKTGMGNIQEQMHAERGFGSSSIEPKLTTDLLNKLIQTQSEQELGAEQWGLGQQASILGSMPGTPTEDTSSPWGAIGESIGSAFGGGGKNDISSILAGTKGTTYDSGGHSLGSDLASSVASKPGSITASASSLSGGGGDFFQNLAKSIGGWGK